MAERNIAAMLNEDAVTISVVFKDHGTKSKPYTYVALKQQGIAKGDEVVVIANGDTKVVYVESVSEDLEIDPNDTMEYGWVIQKVDMEAYHARMATNAQIKDVVRKNYRTNARRAMADMLLAALPTDAKAQINAMLGHAPDAPAPGADTPKS